MLLDTIYALKFVHMIAIAVLFGTWLTIAVFTLFARRSRNTSVVAVTALFVVRAEFMLMLPAVVLTPLAGYPLATAIGANLDEYWIEVSGAIYAAVAVVWLANLMVERRIRRVTQDAAVNGKPLPDSVSPLVPDMVRYHACRDCRHDRHHGADDLAAALVLGSAGPTRPNALQRGGRCTPKHQLPTVPASMSFWGGRARSPSSRANERCRPKARAASARI